MSRIGKKPITIPDGVTVVCDGQEAKVTGSKGELSHKVGADIGIKVEGQIITLNIKKDNQKSRERFGLERTLIANMVEGVSAGFEKKLEFHGVGYRAAIEGRDLVLHIGFSHPYRYTPKEGIEIKTEKNTITVSGISKEAVGQVAAEIRSIKKPEPYKGKGIKYENEKIRRKAGKAAAAKAA